MQRSFPSIAPLLLRLRRLVPQRALPQPVPADGGLHAPALYNSRDTRADPAHHHRREAPATGHQPATPDQRADRALRESEDRFRALFNHAAVGMALCRADSTVILQANRRLADVCGLTQHTLIGRRLVDLVHPADRPALEAAIAALGRDERDHASLELRTRPDGGAEAWLRLHLSCTPAESRPRELAVTAEDISESRLHAQRLAAQAAELARTADRLERSTRELEDFTYAASHDLKEPLRGLNTFAAFTLEDHGHQLDDRGKERLRAMQAQARRMEDLLDALLRFSRYGRHEPVRLTLNTTEIARRAAGALRHQIESRRAVVSIDPLPPLCADPEWTAALLEELIQNAITFTDSPSPGVRISARAGGPDPVVCVRDDGLGIPERHRHAVFKMFKRLHARGRYGGGVGAGLAIAKRIVERHGGRIWAEPNDAGHGTTICFTLPAAGVLPAGPQPVDATDPAPHPDR